MQLGKDAIWLGVMPSLSDRIRRMLRDAPTVGKGPALTLTFQNSGGQRERRVQ